MDPLAELLGKSPAIVAVRDKIRRLLPRQVDARRHPAILLQGETGTGKGLVARAIHRASTRATGPFVDVNCAAIPETLLEAELFGFERGAFTDARQAKPGLFQTAHRGTIFLDEVGLLPEALQSKLLKVLEEHTVRRLGSTRNEPVDVWILTATSEDLLAATRARRFREDLYHRLAVLTLWLPPLRERGQDIVGLAEHFLARACADYGLPPKTLAPDAETALLAYAWPGNVRELSNVMERVALLSEASAVTAEMLGLPVAPADGRERPGREPAIPLEDAVASVEREHLLEALQETNWNVSQAAARLGVSRNTLRYRIEKHGLRPGAPAAPPPRGPKRPGPPAPARQPVGPAAIPPASPVRWERRRLTLLRAALIGSPASESPPDARRALEVLVEKVQSFGGRVEELSPMGLLGVFGLGPMEDAPLRAAHAALAIQKAAERARRDDPEQPAVKMAIHGGQFLVGQAQEAAEIDLDVKREATTVLETLLAGAEAHAIVVSPAAAPLLDRRFELAPLGALPGARGPAYVLAGLERTGLGLGRRMATFVGRRHELELLWDRLTSAMRGRGQVVGIVGEAGIGKSRLLFEFRQGLRREQVTYLEGHCYPYGSAIPYFPALEMLRSDCRLTEADSPDVIAQKVRMSLERLGMDAEKAAPHLLQLLGVKEGTEPLAVLSPEAIQSQTFEILRQMSLNGSRRRPLILALEDLHWLDKSSEAYCASLVDALAGAPILLLLTYRPGYRPPGIEKSYATQMALQPLGPDDSLRVVRSVLEASQIPDDVAQLILAKAEGNPFFLEELARAVGEQSGLRPTLAVPDTIQEVLLARIDRLPEDLKRLLQTAAIWGRGVSVRLLRAIWDEPDALDGYVRELTRLELLYEHTAEVEASYVFKHALTQEVAYESLPPARRQALHAAAGRALEGVYADRLEEAYDRLAYHYSKTDEADKAVEYLGRFADRAARSYAHTEAVTALAEARVHAERLPAEQRDQRVLDLVLRQTDSLSFLGRFPEALELLLGERPRLERLGPASLTGPYHFWLGHTYSYLGDQERAAASAQRAIEEASRCDDESTMGKASLLLAQESSWSGQALQGVEHGQRAVDLLERAGERWWLGLAHWIVGINYGIVGDFDRALEAQARAHATGEAIGDPRIQSYATWSTGMVYALTGEWEAAIDACKRGLGGALDPVNTAVALGHLGYAYLEKGELGEAISILEQSVAQMSRFQFRRLQGRFMTFLGEAYLADGQITKARDLVTQGIQITREAKYWYGLGWAQLALGRIARACGDLPDAQAHLDAALRTFVSVEARFMAGRAHLALADLAHAQGKPEATARHLAEAYQVFRTLRIPKYVERTERLAAAVGGVFSAG